MRSFRFMVALLLMALTVVALVFFVQNNSDPVQLEFWRWRTKPVSLGWLVLLTFFGGIVLSLMLSLSVVFMKSSELSRCRRELASLQKLLAAK